MKKKRNRSPSISEARVYRELKRAIISGGFKPGVSLIQEELCNQFRVSRTPVRDALNHLQAEGLVTAIPHKGVFVRELSARDIGEIYEVRILIECSAAKKAAVKIDRKELRHILGEVLRLQQKNGASFNSVQRTGSKLHRLVVANSGNSMMSEILNRIWAPIEISRIPFRDSHERIEQINREHVEIIEALLKGDGEMASDLMKTHLARSREAHLELLLTPIVAQDFRRLCRLRQY